jgi:twinkle protein
MDYRDFNIDIRSTKTSGEVQCICPQCSHTRKKKSDKCLSVNLNKESWFCHHCGWKGSLQRQRIEEVVYIKPEWKNNTNLSEKVVKWFEQRGISQKTLTETKISEGLEWMPQVNKEVNTIQFNFFRNDELVNVKYRSGAKDFKLHKGSELIFYNLDCIKDCKELIITEGEIDCLSFIESGFKNVVSVPNGANINTNNLQYVDNCIHLFDEIETIFIATDNDIAGRKLRYELAERFGIERCKYLEFETFKDANELLQHKGSIGISDCLLNAKEFPIEGVFTIEDIDLEINDMYSNGLDNGVDTGMANFDRLLRFAKGYITTITGIPGHGKSDFLDQLALKINIKHGWKFAFYSPENKPTRLHISKLARKLIGKKWFGDNRITFDELSQVKTHLNNKFWFIKPEKDFTLDSILKHVKLLKKTKGIDAFVIDAWNKLEHKYSQNETKYIGESLDKLATFCEENNVHCFLVAHPTKMTRQKEGVKLEVPNLYNISGSSNFYNKTDNGITVYRDFDENNTKVFVQKVKFSHWGEIGVAEFDYQLESGRFLTNFNDVNSWLPQVKPIEIETAPFPMIALEDVKTVFDNDLPFSSDDNIDVPF